MSIFFWLIIVISFVNTYIWKILDTTKIGSGKVTDLIGVIIMKKRLVKYDGNSGRIDVDHG